MINKQLYKVYPNGKLTELFPDAVRPQITGLSFILAPVGQGLEDIDSTRMWYILQNTNSSLLTIKGNTIISISESGYELIWWLDNTSSTAKIADKFNIICRFIPGKIKFTLDRHTQRVGWYRNNDDLFKLPVSSTVIATAQNGQSTRVMFNDHDLLINYPHITATIIDKMIFIDSPIKQSFPIIY